MAPEIGAVFFPAPATGKAGRKGKANNLTNRTTLIRRNSYRQFKVSRDIDSFCRQKSATVGSKEHLETGGIRPRIQ